MDESPGWVRWFEAEPTPRGTFVEVGGESVFVGPPPIETWYPLGPELADGTLRYRLHACPTPRASEP